MSKNLLLEIGTEEIPAHVMPGILAQLKENAEKAFKEQRIAFESIRTIGTPRRTALLVQGLAEKQEDVESENRGPSVKIAFDADGNPTKACQGFARGQGVKPEDLEQRDGYVYAHVHTAGQETAKLLEQMLPDFICGLNFPNNMRWADLDFKFIRPLRWIVALFGADIIPFTVAEVASGRTSRGHRYLSAGDFDIPDADSYEKACEAQFVIADQKRREQMIREQITAVARENGGEVEINEDIDYGDNVYRYAMANNFKSSGDRLDEKDLAANMTLQEFNSEGELENVQPESDSREETEGAPEETEDASDAPAENPDDSDEF